MASSTRKIVVDASIAHAAGSEDAVHPTPIHCREFLKAMLACRHMLVMTPEIAREWQRHGSGFARQWRVAMEGRKLVHRAQNDPDPGFRKKLGACCNDEGMKAAVLKDIILVEAALLTDRSISSLDEKIRGHLACISRAVKSIGELTWINADKDDAVAWLNNGAKPHPLLLLKNHRKTSETERKP